MTWVESNPETINKIRLYISDFQNVKPKLFQYFEGGSEPVFPVKVESDRGVALLLCFCALYQNITESRLIRVLSDLWRDYDADIFKLNRLPFQALQDRVNRMEDLQNWVLWPKVPGILRSICDFFYKQGPVVPWVYGVGDAESCVEVLAQEIFMMGKTSAFKSKPRYFMWLLTQLPGSQPERYWNDKANLPVTPGHIRLLRDFGPLKGKSRSPWKTPEEKLDYCNRFYRMLFPGKSWRVYIALDGYLKSTSGFISPLDREPPQKIWYCRSVLAGCLNCILAPDCRNREEI